MSRVGNIRLGGPASSTQLLPSLSLLSPHSTMLSEPPSPTKCSGSQPGAAEHCQRLEKLECGRAISTLQLADVDLRLRNLQQLVEGAQEQRLLKLELDVAANMDRCRTMTMDLLAQLNTRLCGMHQEFGANKTVMRQHGIMIDDIRSFIDERAQSFSTIGNSLREPQGSASKPTWSAAEAGIRIGDMVDNLDMEMVQQRLQKLESALSSSKQEHQAMTSEVPTMLDIRLQALQQKCAVGDSPMDIMQARPDLQESAAKPDKAQSNPDMEMVQQQLQILWQNIESTTFASEQKHQTMKSEVHTMLPQSSQQYLAKRNSLIQQHGLESDLLIKLKTMQEEQGDAAKLQEHDKVVATPLLPRRFHVRSKEGLESPNSFSTNPGSPEESLATWVDFQAGAPQLRTRTASTSSE